MCTHIHPKWSDVSSRLDVKNQVSVRSLRLHTTLITYTDHADLCIRSQVCIFWTFAKANVYVHPYPLSIGFHFCTYTTIVPIGWINTSKSRGSNQRADTIRFAILHDKSRIYRDFRPSVRGWYCSSVFQGLRVS